MGKQITTWYHDQINTPYFTANQTAGTGFQSEIVNREAIVESVGDDLIERFIESGKKKEELADYHGAIQFRFPSASDGTTNSVNIAFRANSNMFVIPVIGERVLVTQVSPGIYVYSFPLNTLNDVNNNISDGFDERTNIIADKDTYSVARDKSFVNINDNLLENQATFINQTILPVNFKEGDLIFEGRYSNFVKLSSEEDNKHPVIIIGTKPNNITDTTLFTNSNTIMISSNNKVVIPDFKRNISAIDYTKYTFNGNQMIMMSDRVFIGSRSNQIFLMSNSHIHLSSQDITSIDSNSIMMKSVICDISSTVLLGNKTKKSPATKADVLKDILQDLLIALSSHTHGVTGAVTTMAANANTFSSLLNRLNSIYSEDVFIS